MAFCLDHEYIVTVNNLNFSYWGNKKTIVLLLHSGGMIIVGSRKTQNDPGLHWPLLPRTTFPDS